MLLADDEQIVALSTLSRDAAGSYFHQKAMNFAQIDNRAEAILPLAPDIVLTGSYTSRYTLALFDELELETVSLSIANSFEQMLANLEKVGVIVRQQQRATELVQSLRARMENIKQRVEQLDAAALASDKGVLRAAVYDPNGYTVGENSLRGEAIKIAGWHNVALDRGISDYGVLQLEDLIRLAPDALVESPYSPDTYSRGQALSNHPSLRQSGLDPLLINVPSSHTICAGPWIIDVIEQLVSARDLF